MNTWFYYVNSSSIFRFPWVEKQLYLVALPPMVLKVRAYPFFQLKAHSEISFDAPKKPSNLLYVLALMCTIG